MKKGKVIWFTGLPCSGKTTLARILKEKYFPSSLFLDGDNVRNSHISPDCGFSPEDRAKHLRRIGEFAKRTADTGNDVICSFVSPIRSIREELKESISTFFEVFVDCPPEVCSQRDVKGMWEKAKKGEIKGFTGYDAPYEAPENPDTTVLTGIADEEFCINRILEGLNKRFSRALFIGRWQPFHKGHMWIIKESLDKGIPVAIGCRDLLPDDSNPYNFEKVKRRIEKFLKGEDIIIFQIPDIRSVNFGRGVGYDIIKHDAPGEIEKISATMIRKERIK